MPDRTLRLPALIYRTVVTPNLPVLALVCCYVLLCALTAMLFGLDLELSIYNDVVIVVSFAAFALALCGLSVVSLWRERPEQPTRFIWQKLTVDWQVWQRAGAALPVLIVFSLFFSVFTSMKSAIPKIVPFYADPYAAALDRWIHGMDAWKLIAPVTGHPFAVLLFDSAYGLWLGQLLLAIGIAAFMIKRPGLRQQFLVSLVISWALLGTVLAIMFSSVGPCFYEAFYGDDRYAPLLEHLAKVRDQYHLFALDAQEHLLQTYLARDTGLATGISALPSMHVASSAVAALFLTRINRLLGTMNWLVMIGSVQLGWHYAVDGYLALALVTVIWIGAGRWAASRALMPG
jgi:hypothetical protein